MIVLAKVALATAVVALALGAYVFFVLGETAGIVAMALAGAVAALAAVLGAQARNERGRDDARR